MTSLLTFPNPVNEKTARTVAAGVVVLTVVTIATGWTWLSILIALGFLARVASGPRFSPLGQLANRVIAPRLGAPKLVAGPPKRFAQAVGATFSVGAVIAWAGFGSVVAADVLLAFITVAALLESALGLCLGCRGFALLMRAGLIPAETCEACNNIGLRYSHTG